MASTTSYRVSLVLTVKKPKDTVPTTVDMQIVVAVMSIEQAIAEARLYLDALKIQNSTGWVSSLEFTDIIKLD
jgi:hypothetical protein